MLKLSRFLLALTFVLVVGTFSESAYSEQGKDKDGPKKGLVFKESWKEDLKGVYLATSTGDVLVHTEQWVRFYDVNGKLVWKKDDLNFVTGGGVSREGDLIIYQSSPVPKTGQLTTLDLTVHILNHQGDEVLSKPNPYRYFNTLLSPKGTYIVFGEATAKKIYVYDKNLNPLWERETYLWYIGFDPDERFLFDSVSGMLLNTDGRRVWELPAGQKFLGISSGAEVVLSQPFLTIGSGRNKLYLTNRVSLEQVILDGYCAGVSYDGSLIAYQGLDRKVLVYRTRELFEKEKGRGEANPVWSLDINLAKLLQFSRDAQSLFIYGETSQKYGKAIFIDLNSGKKLWDKEWFSPLLKYVLSEDNRFFLAQTDSRSIEYYCLK
jgi:hypothetical protein